MKIDMLQIGGENVLSGSQNGRVAFARLLQTAASEPAQAQLLFLDFSRIGVATASYLREAIVAFRDVIRSRRSNFYPVIANANVSIKEELRELLHRRGSPLMACTLDRNGHVVEVSLLGELDSKQRVTFDLVQALGETDAGELMRAYGESEGTKHATAWNNRLSVLASLGLLIETSQGRAKRYRPLFKEA